MVKDRDTYDRYRAQRAVTRQEVKLQKEWFTGDEGMISMEIKKMF